MNFLRFLVLASLAVWIGSLIFFPMVAAISFSLLPSPQAGLLVRGALIKLHWTGMVSGVLFFLISLLYERFPLGKARMFSPARMAVVVMLALTVVSEFLIIPKMDLLRASAGEISSLAATHPLRAQFESLHAWSVRTEGAVLLLGLAALYSVARAFSPRW